MKRRAKPKQDRILYSRHGKAYAVEGARPIYGELACLHGSIRGHHCAKCAKEK